MLGGDVIDPHGVEAPAIGLGLISGTTSLGAAKEIRRRSATFAASVGEPWSDLAGRTIKGYEIRFGRTAYVGPAVSVLPDGLGFTCGNVLAPIFMALSKIRRSQPR